LANNQPRRHHYTPVLLLKRFTDSEERLHVISRQKGTRFVATPNAIGFENDFYTLDHVEDGDDPQAVEKAFAQFEGEASAVLDEVIANRAIPASPDKFNTLMNFVAFSAARIPAMRTLITRPIEEIAEMILQMNLSSEAQFRYSFTQAGIDVDAIGLTYEAAKEMAAGMSIKVTTAAYINHMNTVVNILLPLLAQRTWCILYNKEDGPLLIVTDNPVGISWSDGHRPGHFFDIPAFGRLGTDVTIPLNSHFALIGEFEELPKTIEMDDQAVAAINTKTLGGCQRFIAGAADNFTCINDAGEVVTDKDVTEHLKKLAEQKG
jgi:Protein of unknown function (DUF4238)